MRTKAANRKCTSAFQFLHGLHFALKTAIQASNEATRASMRVPGIVACERLLCVLCVLHAKAGFKGPPNFDFLTCLGPFGLRGTLQLTATRATCPWRGYLGDLVPFSPSDVWLIAACPVPGVWCACELGRDPQQLTWTPVGCSLECQSHPDALKSGLRPTPLRNATCQLLVLGKSGTAGTPCNVQHG